MQAGVQRIMCVVVSVISTLHEKVCYVKQGNRFFESMAKFMFHSLVAIAIAQWGQYSPNIPRQITESVDASELMDSGNSGAGTSAFND
jgi:hypothetical protein